MKFSVFFARFPYGAIEHPDTTEWLISTAVKCKLDPRVDKVHYGRFDDTPITMTRNLAVERAKEAGADYLVMIDNDMSPDIPVLGAKPFWESTMEFMLNHNGPCIVTAPYCGPPPRCNIYVFQWANWMNNSAQPDIKLDQFTREQAAQLSGIQRVGAAPTGICIIDMRTFKKLKPPYFYYEWADKELQHQKASTEDVTFTRDADMLGIPVYCNWDAWAGHWKRYRVDKPVPIYSEAVSEKYRQAVIDNISLHKKLVIVGDTPAADGPREKGPNRMPNPLLQK
jgi:hypothetical protein